MMLLVQNSYFFKILVKILKKGLEKEKYMLEICSGLFLYNTFLIFVLMISFELEQLNANTTVVKDEYIDASLSFTFNFKESNDQIQN
jgi:hypothetical protein